MCVYDTLFKYFDSHNADKSPRNPVVFCHGLLGFDSVTIGPAIAPLEVTHWRGIKEVLEENGTEVLITRVPATSSPAERAKVLEQRISQVYPGRSVHLIGQSCNSIGETLFYFHSHTPVGHSMVTFASINLDSPLILRTGRP